MITREELSELKEKKKTSLYYVEKEYLQYIFLNALFKHNEDFAFKGGTCLRICYGLERASEDIDFSTQLKSREIKPIVERCLHDFDLLNIRYKVYAEKKFLDNVRFEIRFEGPLFTGQLSSTNTLKIDFNYQKAKYIVVKVVAKIFSDVPLFTLRAVDEKEIFAEKIRTLANRGQPRDLYDIWMLSNKGVEFDNVLIVKKLKEERSVLTETMFPSKEEYERDLKNLVVVVPPYEQVRKEVNELLRSLMKN